MEKQIMCHCRHLESGTVVSCTVRGTDACPLHTREFSKLAKSPCADSIWIPTSYIDRKISIETCARKYLEAHYG